MIDEAEGEDRYHVAATSTRPLEDGRVLKHDDTFAVFDRSGDVARTGHGEQGLYHRGTRHLSRMTLRVNGHRLLVLGSSVGRDNLVLAVDLTNPDLHDESGALVVPHGSLHVLRTRLLRDGACLERIHVSNFGVTPVEFSVRVSFEADFADIFEVRGTARERHGERLPTKTSGPTVTLAYRGLDDVVRTTEVTFDPPPGSMTEHAATFPMRLDVKETRVIEVRVAADPRAAASFEPALATALDEVRRVAERECAVESSNEQFNDWLERSHADLRMMTTATPQGPYPYAGVPWFSTPFGRDGIWTALEALWIAPDLAAGVLRFLAATQADEVDPTADAEPGKILHEAREGEMAALGEIPFGRYYGSVDSTPLFIMLAARYWDATGDLGLIERIWPRLLAALAWIDRWGDGDGDGFVEYARHSKDGLVQQGWKDSSDSVSHRDGSLAEAPIAICEVQGYAYAARRGMARLARALGDDRFAAKLERQAMGLKAQFDAAFWCDALGTYALALDGAKRPCEVRASNAGHCLYAGIALPDRVGPLSSTLMGDDMFSGWGVRTLASSERRYNPMSYHNGSVWPHDSAIVAAGFARYGMTECAVRVLGGLFDASLYVDEHRLPELFCGFARRPREGPTLYPVACSPQAWASASPFLLLKSVLGLHVDGNARRVTFRRPRLPTFLQHVTVRNLRVGDARLDFRLHHYPEDVGLNVMRKDGPVEVVVVR